MEQTWRWFGPDDPVTLPEIRQTGATGIVSALHHVPYGEVWTLDEIRERNALITADPLLGLRWSVVESLPVAEDVKLGRGDLSTLFGNYRQSIRNLAACGVTTICYNFMPLLDWTRTELEAPLPGGATALRMNAHQLAAFDCFMLERPGAEADYGHDVIVRADAWYRASSESERDRLLDTIMAGLPGAYTRYDIPGLRRELLVWRDLSRDDLRANLGRFLNEIVPTAEEVGVRLAIHPDDPPRPIFGLPRVVGSGDDLAFILAACDSPANGLAFCTGSLGAGPANDVPDLARRFAHRTYFAHLRNVSKEPDGSFVEAEHLGGDVDIVSVMVTLLQEQKRRRDVHDPHWRIPFRPDHGHQLLDDIYRRTHPGYPAIGRLRGLAELRGVMTAVASLQSLPLQ